MFLKRSDAFAGPILCNVDRKTWQHISYRNSSPCRCIPRTSQLRTSCCAKYFSFNVSLRPTVMHFSMRYSVNNSICTLRHTLKYTCKRTCEYTTPQEPITYTMYNIIITASMLLSSDGSIAQYGRRRSAIIPGETITGFKANKNKIIFT